jgi:hypothetical protein
MRSCVLFGPCLATSSIAFAIVAWQSSGEELGGTLAAYFAIAVIVAVASCVSFWISAIEIQKEEDAKDVAKLRVLPVTDTPGQQSM